MRPDVKQSALVVILSMILVANSHVLAEPITLTNVVDPGPNRLDEPRAEGYSLQRAVDFLDAASLQWQKQRKCFTCHTNVAYLYARPYVSSKAEAHDAVREHAEWMVRERWQTEGPRWDAEVVAMAAALAFNDAKTTGRLHSSSKTALDRMWSLQRKDGGWDWLKCDWPPFEYDDHYGVTLAAIAVGVAPNDYGSGDLPQKGMAGIRRYLLENAPTNAHHRAMLLWAATYHDKLISPDQKQAWVNELLSLQKQDGGWCSATLGDWQREDGSEQDTISSDGYGTGFVLFVLQTAGVPRQDARILRGIEWLKTHQRASGRWITRSLYTDNKHFLSHAGSAFAVMALTLHES